MAGTETEGGDKSTYCYCNGASYGEMIGCDDDDCEIEWVSTTCFSLLPSCLDSSFGFLSRPRPLTLRYPLPTLLPPLSSSLFALVLSPQYHLDCLRLSAPPDGTWHCPTCSKRRADEKAQKAAQRAASKAGRGRGR